jgi:hypothetical protein
MHGLWTRLRRRRLHAAALVGVVAALTLAIVAIASHSEVSLPGSEFEIDTDANIKVDDPAPPSLDWANVAETRQTDEPSGAGDDSFGNGSKEDTAVPSVVNGSIPPNKSDLLTFGVYLEKTAAGRRFLHLYWHRVQEPSGTTNMDFEFNQSKTISSNSVTPVRTSGDLLVQYDLSQGGTTPELFLSRWIAVGDAGMTAADCEAANKLPCWGERANLTAQGDATGSINTSPIDETESDGLGDISARTFGEASLDFDEVAPTGTACAAFGSAYLKSRSSDSFTAAMKDFIAPEALNLAECGAIQITKMRKHAASGAGDHPHQGVGFTITPPGGTESAAKTTDANGKVCFDNLALSTDGPDAGTDPDPYTVHEVTPAGYKTQADKTVVVDTVASCADNPYVGETVSFLNVPLTDITVSVNSQVTGGTASKIDCTGLATNPPDGTPTAFDDTSETFEDLDPGTYTCTVVVDP